MKKLSIIFKGCKCSNCGYNTEFENKFSDLHTEPK